jgi:hypothetical protein
MTTTGFVFLCAAQLGWLWAVCSNTTALAEELTEPTPTIGLSVQCRGFHSDLGKSEPPAMDTSDRLTEVGQWVGKYEDLGMSLHSVDFEVGQKTTNYPEAWVYVCMRRGPSAAQ